MDVQTVSHVLDLLVKGLVLALVGIVWFGIQRYLNNQDKREEAARAEAEANRKAQASMQIAMATLNATMRGLQNSITDLRDEFVTKTQHERDLADLRKEGSAFGRRRLDHCINPECPFENTPHLYEEG